MVFFDTCIWIELLAVRNPVQPNEIRQASVASGILSDVVADGEKIVSCKEQLVEIIKTVEKLKLKEVNNIRKQNSKPRIDILKNFRLAPEFRQTQVLFNSIIDDIYHFAEVKSIGNWELKEVLQRLHLADINDCMYYDYCMKNQIDLYSFDNDLKLLGESPLLHIV